MNLLDPEIIRANATEYNKLHEKMANLETRLNEKKEELEKSYKQQSYLRDRGNRLVGACKVAILALTHEPINPKDVEFVKAAIAKAEKKV